MLHVKQIRSGLTSYNMSKKTPDSKQTALIIYAHPEPKSFNGALRDTAVKTLQAQEYDVIVSDLYAQKFQPVISRSDIVGELQNAEHFSYPTETAEAYKKDKLCSDVKNEIEKLKKADIVIFQFPIQWGSAPAILKGWFDRVLVSGFAFEFPRIYDEGLLKGKRALLSITTGSPGGMFTPIGIHGDISVILWPIQYMTLRFCGFDVLPPQCSYSPGFADDTQRKTMLDAWQTRLQKIHKEKPMEFPSLSNFDQQKWFIMSDQYQEDQKRNEFGPSVAHHLGKKVPKTL